MLKTIKIVLLALVVSLVLPTNAYADTEDSTVTVNINTTAPTDAVTPVNPDNPSEDRVPLTPGTGATDIDNYNPATGNTGPLTIDTVPSFIFQEYVSNAFTNVKMGTGNKNLYTSYTTPYVQISDRRGTGAGWNLSLKAGHLVAQNVDSTVSGGIPNIPYVLNLKVEDTHPIGQRGYTLGNHIVDLAPTPISSTYAINASSSPVDVRLLDAPEGKGIGTWIYRFDGGENGTSINLNTDLVRKNINTSNETTYVSQLTWTLADAPGQ